MQILQICFLSSAYILYQTSCCRSLLAIFSNFVVYELGMGSFEQKVKLSKLVKNWHILTVPCQKSPKIAKKQKLLNTLKNSNFKVKYEMGWLVFSPFKMLAKIAVFLTNLTFEIFRKIPKLVILGASFGNLLKCLGHTEQKPFSFQSFECFEWPHHWSLACQNCGRFFFGKIVNKLI